MPTLRLDNIGIVVNDMDAAVEFFTEIGPQLEGRGTYDGPWMDRAIALDGAQCEIAMLRMPDGHGAVELSRFVTPSAADDGANDAPVSTLGYLRAMFAVEDVRDLVARLGRLGARLVGEIVTYEDAYLLCYVRSREGFIVGLAQDLRGAA
jgi:catechol 2,3-dioxygenase-like lactoylglutathione lyase family enzyme